MTTCEDTQRAQGTVHLTTLEDQHLLVIEVKDHIEAEETSARIIMDSYFDGIHE